jgi:hypothetical protein
MRRSEAAYTIIGILGLGLGGISTSKFGSGSYSFTSFSMGSLMVVVIMARINLMTRCEMMNEGRWCIVFFLSTLERRPSC